MAEVNIPALFDRLGEQMLGLSQTIKSQGVTLDITPFDRKAKDFKNWIKAVEKHARLNQLNEDQNKLVAYQTTRGAVSHYLDRVLNEHPGYEWEQIKSKLSSRVAEILRDLSGQGSYAAEVQKQLVNFFIDGLWYDYIKIKVMRENYEISQDAVTIAMTEFYLRKRVDVITGHDYYIKSNIDSGQEEPMNISHYCTKPQFKRYRRLLIYDLEH